MIPVMRIRLPDDYPADFFAWPFHERAALLCGQKSGRTFSVSHVVPVRNSHRNPREHFAVRRSELVRVEQAYGPVVGALHTHPAWCSSEPSENDLSGLPEGWVGGVLHRDRIHWYLRHHPDACTPTLIAVSGSYPEPHR